MAQPLVKERLRLGGQVALPHLRFTEKLQTSMASQAGRLPGSCRPCGAEADRARVGAPLVSLPPPRVIFAPR
jgi:hypothetical protein